MGSAARPSRRGRRAADERDFRGGAAAAEAGAEQRSRRRSRSSGHRPKRAGPARRTASGRCALRPLAVEHAARERRQRVRDRRRGGRSPRWRRCWWRAASAAATRALRMREICRCCSTAMVSPNQPMLLRLAKIVGACSPGRRSAPPAPRRTGLRSRCWARRAAPPTANDGAAQRAAVEVAERDVHHLGEPAKAGRDELAERHQVVLVVAVEAAGQRRRSPPRCRPPSWCSPLLELPSGRPISAARPGCAKALEQRLPVGRRRAARAAAG